MDCDKIHFVLFHRSSLHSPILLTVLLFLFGRTFAAFAADIVVPAGGNLQTAINSAVAGGTITLAAGATYVGSFAPVVVCSAQSGSAAQSTFQTAHGANHYRLTGLYAYDIVQIGLSDEQIVSDLPSSFQIDHGCGLTALNHYFPGYTFAKNALVDGLAYASLYPRIIFSRRLLPSEFTNAATKPLPAAGRTVNN